jgi:1,4-alpha-glucan branching enzyme
VVLVVCNFTPIPRHGYRVGVPWGGFWRELLNSDAHAYGGSGEGNLGGVHAEAGGSHGFPYVLSLLLPPLGILFLKGEAPPEQASGGRPSPEALALPGADAVP